MQNWPRRGWVEGSRVVSGCTVDAQPSGTRTTQGPQDKPSLTVGSSLKPSPPIVQVEEQKRRAEADKLAAITALEQRSREFMREKEAKARLEARIASMQSQLLVGGAALEETPVFRRAAPLH